MCCKPSWIWLFRTGAYDPETAERDAAAIKAFYVARGFLNARVGHRIDFEVDDETHLILTFQIEEGLQHIIESVEYTGNTVFDDSVLESMMQSTIGSIVDTDILKIDHDRLLMEYGRLGYLYVNVSLSHVFSEEDGYVHLTVRIDEGDQYRVGRIQVRGNRHTRDNVIRRELRFFPEDLYDTEAVRKAEQRLVETRLFNEAHIIPGGKTPGVREALVTVEEADTTTILFGVGVTSNSGVVGSISIEQRNFDIFDWPRTSKEFFSFRSFRGRGQTMRLSLEPGTELTRARLEFREPYLFDREIGLGLGIYVFERGRQEYDERRIGFTTSFDKRWREGPLEGWAGEIALRFESVNITGADSFTSREILEDEGNNWLTSVKGSLVHDRTDSFWLPTQGDRLKLSVEQVGALGGDHTFTKAIGTYDHYWTVKTDTFGRKHVVQLGTTLGQIFGDAPVFEKFHAGGIGSIRGFEFRGITEDLYDTEAVRKAEQRLVETRLFNEAHIIPGGKTPGVREALVTVEEADTTTILFGVGVTSNSGVVGSISIEQRNFDIFDWPRTSKEFFSFRSFRGRGQTMRLSLEPGTELTRARLEFREPYLFDREIGLGLGIYVFERGRQEYDERRIGFTTSFDKRWREGPLEGWAGEIALRFESVNITGADSFTSREILEDEGNNWLTSVKGSLVHDRTDSFWLPTQGDRLKLSVEQVGALGGDHTFTKAIGTYDHYWTVK